MPWLYLLLAALCEMSWPLGFKLTDGFKSNYPAIGGTLIIMLLSFWLLSLATTRGIPIGTAYAVWTGLGAAGTTIIGIAIFKEPRDVLRLSCLALIILGAVGLKFFTPASPPTAP
jgi:quaternary ammonium compound-resistance protein SugE